jgi:hypothetical protein
MHEDPTPWRSSGLLHHLRVIGSAYTLNNNISSFRFFLQPHFNGVTPPRQIRFDLLLQIKLDNKQLLFATAKSNASKPVGFGMSAPNLSRNFTSSTVPSQEDERSASFNSSRGGGQDWE